MVKTAKETKKTPRRDAKAQNVFDAFIGSIEYSYAWEPEAFVQLADHRTFEWYVQFLIQRMEEDEWHLLKLASFRPNKNTLALVDDVFRALHTLFEKKRIAPELFELSYAISESSISPDQGERLRYHLLAKLKAYIAKAKRQSDLHGVYRLVPPPKRRSPRDRSELPDPSAPAWTSANRQRSSKVQITARVSPKIKELSLEAAEEREISHSQWLSEAIVRQLLAEGYDTALEKAFRPRQDVEPLKRRPQRPRRALPEPQEPAYVSANRADKIISLRIDPELAREIDRAREEDEDRSAWFRTAVNTFLYVREAKLPKPLSQRPRLSVPVSLSFEPPVMFVVGHQVKDSGLTLSEWLRRVARWYIWYRWHG